MYSIRYRCSLIQEPALEAAEIKSYLLGKQKGHHRKKGGCGMIQQIGHYLRRIRDAGGPGEFDGRPCGRSSGPVDYLTLHGVCLGERRIAGGARRVDNSSMEVVMVVLMDNPRKSACTELNQVSDWQWKSRFSCWLRFLCGLGSLGLARGNFSGLNSSSGLPSAASPTTSLQFHSRQTPREQSATLGV